MIIDCILARHDDEKNGYFNYNAKDFYLSVMSYGNSENITRVMDSGTEEEAKKALCDYIDVNGYNPLIKTFINNRLWTVNDKRIKSIINI